MPLLYIFIANYKNSPIPSIKSFALGLEKDIDAVENAVASDLTPMEQFEDILLL